MCNTHYSFRMTISIHTSLLEYYIYMRIIVCNTWLCLHVAPGSHPGAKMVGHPICETTVSRCIAPIHYQRPRSKVVYWRYTPYNRGSYNIYYSIRTAVFRSIFSRAARYRSVSASASRVRTVTGSSQVLRRRLSRSANLKRFALPSIERTRD